MVPRVGVGANHFGGGNWITYNTAGSISGIYTCTLEVLAEFPNSVFRMFALRVLLALEVMYRSYSQYSQCLGLQYYSYSKY